jgi:hypothetical protein
MKRRSSDAKVIAPTKTEPSKERPVNTSKYIGMDVHMATTVIAVINDVGKVLSETILETKATTILDFLKSQRGTVHVTFEEGTQAAWLHDLIRPHVAKELDCLTELRNEAEKELLAEARKHSATKILRSIPGIGPLRAAVILGFTITPHRFRTKNQFWKYCGLAVMSEITGEYALIDGRVFRSRKKPLVRGLNINYNHALKEAFKGAATTDAMGVWRSHFDALVANGTRPSLVLLTLARKIASITLAVWKRGELYDTHKLKFMHAV